MRLLFFLTLFFITNCSSSSPKKDTLLLEKSPSQRKESVQTESEKNFSQTDGLLLQFPPKTSASSGDFASYRSICNWDANQSGLFSFKVYDSDPGNDGRYSNSRLLINDVVVWKANLGSSDARSELILDLSTVLKPNEENSVALELYGNTDTKGKPISLLFVEPKIEGCGLSWSYSASSDSFSGTKFSDTKKRLILEANMTFKTATLMNRGIELRRGRPSRKSISAKSLHFKYPKLRRSSANDVARFESICRWDNKGTGDLSFKFFYDYSMLTPKNRLIPRILVNQKEVWRNRNSRQIQHFRVELAKVLKKNSDNTITIELLDAQEGQDSDVSAVFIKPNIDGCELEWNYTESQESMAGSIFDYKAEPPAQSYSHWSLKKKHEDQDEKMELDRRRTERRKKEEEERKERARKKKPQQSPQPMKGFKTREEVVLPKVSKSKTASRFWSLTHARVHLVGGEFVRIEDLNESKEVVALPVLGYGWPLKEAAHQVIQENGNYFRNHVYLPSDKVYKLTVRKDKYFPFLKVFANIPSKKYVEFISYDDLQQNESDETEVTFIIGRKNKDKILERSDGRYFSPDALVRSVPPEPWLDSIQILRKSKSNIITWSNSRGKNLSVRVYRRIIGENSKKNWKKIYQGRKSAFVDHDAQGKKMADYQYQVQLVSGKNTSPRSAIEPGTRREIYIGLANRVQNGRTYTIAWNGRKIPANAKVSVIFLPQKGEWIVIASGIDYSQHSIKWTPSLKYQLNRRVRVEVEGENLSFFKNIVGADNAPVPKTVEVIEPVKRRKLSRYEIREILGGLDTQISECSKSSNEKGYKGSLIVEFYIRPNGQVHNARTQLRGASDIERCVLDLVLQTKFPKTSSTPTTSDLPATAIFEI